MDGLDPSLTVARLSSPWEYDDASPDCTECHTGFNHLNRRHHCRLCGRVFCNNCSSQRSLIPPSSIVLTPKGGKKVKVSSEHASFQPEDDPDRMLTYLRDPSYSHQHPMNTHQVAADLEFQLETETNQENSQDDRSHFDQDHNMHVQEHQQPDTILYGRGLEERFKLAREPLRVCDVCHAQLQGVQEELRASNSNAMRYNGVDPTDLRRLFNSPLAFTLGHEVRKAAYTLNNLLPMPRKMAAFVNFHHDHEHAHDMHDPCQDTCADLTPTLNHLDGVRIPARLLEQARGVAVLTVIKGGFGIAGMEFGTGLVVARLPNGRGWSAPSAIGTAGMSWGALIGAQVSDHVFLLMTDAAVELMFSNDGSFQLGADVGVAVGPLGRSLEADFGATTAGGSGGAAAASIYTYSLSKGLYAGISLDGKVIVTRHRVNERFYGQRVHASDLLHGEVPTPPAAQPLYDALKRCHVYATTSDQHSATARRLQQQQHHQQQHQYQQQQSPPFTSLPPIPTGARTYEPAMDFLS